jgi:plasmid stabilization system protein ParE
MALVLHPDALQEAQQARQWYENQNPDVAEQFEEALDVVIRSIESSPLLGSPFRTNYRWKRMTHFPYLIYYRIRDDGDIVVLAIAHQYRRLGYWARRDQS